MPLCRISFNNAESARRLLSSGLRIGYGLFRCEEPHLRPDPTQCFKCQAYGHMSRDCTSAAMCRICGQAAHKAKGELCPNERRCANCSGPHSAAYRGCPKFREAVTILASPPPPPAPTVAEEGEETRYRVKALLKAKATSEAASRAAGVRKSQPVEEALLSKIGGLLCVALGNLLKEGFILNSDPSRADSQALSDLQSIIQSTVASFIGNPAHTSGQEGTPGQPTPMQTDQMMSSSSNPPAS